MNKIRALKADEIECRVAQVYEKGARLLLYKDARCDKRILDEVFGSMNWQDRYEEIKGNMYCSVGVYNEKTGEWIWKQDCGTESFADKEKGEASDSFKRACFNWGIGRELYTKIFIWVNVPTEKLPNGGYKIKDRKTAFHVSHIVTDNEREKITELQISDNSGNVCFSYYANGDIKKEIMSALKGYSKEEAAKKLKDVFDGMNIKTVDEVTREMLPQIIEKLKSGNAA